MPSCAVPLCKNYSKKQTYKEDRITYHSFPRDPKLKQKWINATGNAPGWIPSKKSSVCSDHFTEDCYQKFKYSRRLFEWAVPTLKLRCLFTALRPPSRKKSAEKPQPETATTTAPLPDISAVPVSNKRSSTKSTQTLEVEVRPIIKKPRITIKDVVILKPPDISEEPKDTTKINCEHDLERKDVIVCSKCKAVFDQIVNEKDSIKRLEGTAQRMIATVYNFLEHEFTELTKRYGNIIDLSPLMKIRQRTADATGVSHDTVGKVLRHQKVWFAACKLTSETPDEFQPPKKRKRTQKKRAPEIEISPAISDDDFIADESEDDYPLVGYTSEREWINVSTATSSVNENMSLHEEEWYKKECRNASTATSPVPFDMSEDEYYRKECKNASTSTSPVQDILMTEEEFYKAHNVSVENIEENTLNPEYIEIEFQDMDMSNTMINNSTGNIIESEPLMTIPLYSSVDASTNTMISETNDAIIETEPLESIGQQYCGIVTINPMISPSNNAVMETQQLLPTESHYSSGCNVETINPLISSNSAVQASYCIVDPMNPMIAQPNAGVIEAPLVATEHHGCSIDPTTNTINLNHPNVVIEAQPIVTTDPQYLSSTGEVAPMMNLQQADFTDGINYYVIM